MTHNVKREARNVRNVTLRGLTLLESLITLAIFTLIMAAIVNSVLLFYRANASSIEQAYQIESARKGVNLLVRDIRETSYAEDGSYPLSAISSSSLTFYADTDRDTAVEKIRYQLSGNSLMRTVTDPSGDPPTYSGTGTTTMVSEYVRNTTQNVSVFQFFDASSTEITSASDIVRIISVTINLIVNVTPDRDPGEFTLRSSATLRNLRPQ
ncbi:MAG TPA: prepilin-type N-terminal cleavage/methylation domain-containing protein, partial [Candidatus Paceibacterota bacterium]